MHFYLSTPDKFSINKNLHQFVADAFDRYSIDHKISSELFFPNDYYTFHISSYVPVIIIDDDKAAIYSMQLGLHLNNTPLESIHYISILFSPFWSALVNARKVGFLLCQAYTPENGLLPVQKKILLNGELKILHAINSQNPNFSEEEYEKLFLFIPVLYYYEPKSCSYHCATIVHKFPVNQPILPFTAADSFPKVIDMLKASPVDFLNTIEEAFDSYRASAPALWLH